MNKIKKTTFLAICLYISLFTLDATAQERRREHEERRGQFDVDAFMAQRNTFITEKVGLTAEEAAVFIPLDNELMRKKFEVGRDCHRLERELHNKKDKTDEECNRLLKCREEVKEKRNQLDKDYLEKFRKVLSAEQIVKYQRADREFFDSFFRDRRR